MIPEQWTPPCGNECTHKYAALMQIPWRVFCKKGCDADGETWEESAIIRCGIEKGTLVDLESDDVVLRKNDYLTLGMSECNEICYKDPVLKDRQWSAYIDRSPGSARYSEECFHACVSGCGFKFEVPPEKVSKVHPNRPVKPPSPPKPSISAAKTSPPPNSSLLNDDILSTSA